MRKNISRLLVVTLLLSIIMVTVVGCSPENKLERMLKKLNSKNPNYEMVITITAPIVGSTEVITKVDGNKTWTKTSISSEYIYTEKADGKLYTYERDGDVWIKRSEPLEDEKGMFSDFDAADFDYFDGLFVMRPDKAEENGYEKVDIVVDKNLKGMTINTVQIVEGVPMNGKIVISNCGKVKLKLPR